MARIRTSTTQPPRIVPNGNCSSPLSNVCVLLLYRTEASACNIPIDMLIAPLLGLPTMPLTPPALSPILLTALHIAPLITSTASLTHAYMEYITTTAFLAQPRLTSRVSSLILSHYHQHKQPHSSPPASAADVPHNPSSAQTPFAASDLKAAKQVVIPAWFTSFFNTGVYSVIGLNSLTLLGGLVNIYIAPRSGSSGVAVGRKWYGLGVLAAVAHYAFVPCVGHSVGALFALCEREKEGDGVGENTRRAGMDGKDAEGWLREWVGSHWCRMVTSDVAAWGCFFVSVVGGLGVEGK